MLRLTSPEKPFTLVNVTLALGVKVLFWYTVRLLRFVETAKSEEGTRIDPGPT